MASVVTAKQPDAALEVLEDAAELTESTLAVEGDAFAVVESTVAVGGQLVTIRGLAGEYADVQLPIFGRHQAENAAVAVAAVEAFIGGGSVRLADSVVQLGLAAATSPGRLQVVGAEPTIVVDAAHNPHGAAALVAGLDEYFDFDEVAFVFGVLADKDVAGIVDTLARRAGPFVVTAPESDRAVPAEQLGTFVADRIGAERVSVAPRLDDALDEARAWAAEAPKRAVVVAGSIALVGEAMIIAADREWGR